MTEGRRSLGGTARRTPPLLWLLGALVVVGVYGVAGNRATDPGRRLTAWRDEALGSQELAAALSDAAPDRRGHALVQFALQNARAREAGDAGALAALDTHADAVLRQFAAPEPLLRSLAIAASVGIVRADLADRLKALLTDEDPKVSLNAALALAARGDPAGAPRLVEVLEGLPGDDRGARREILKALSPIAGPEHREILLRSADRARLDGDREALVFCEIALHRIGG